jgi:hypothetical protein
LNCRRALDEKLKAADYADDAFTELIRTELDAEAGH